MKVYRLWSDCLNIVAKKDYRVDLLTRTMNVVKERHKYLEKRWKDTAHKDWSSLAKRKEYWEFKPVFFQLKGSNILKENRGLECVYKITQISESA